MDIRVLTLFDDEDFLPQEEPKKTPKKAAAAKKEEQPEATEAIEEAEEIKEKVTTLPEAEAIAPVPEAGPGRIPEPEAAVLPEEKMPEEAQIIEPAAEEATPSAAAPIEEEEMLPAEPVNDAVVAQADEELNRQILSELIQTDYTALIHKDYPFDIQKASVVQKEKPAKAPEPEPEEEEVPESYEEVAPLPEWNLDKKYYTIGEVAQLFAVNTSHIRFWTNEFKLKPRTTRKGDRLYSPADIAELRLIHHLVKVKKHTIKGAREKLKTEKTGVNNKLDLKESLTGLRNMLIQIKEQL